MTEIKWPYLSVEFKHNTNEFVSASNKKKKNNQYNSFVKKLTIEVA